MANGLGAAIAAAQARAGRGGGRGIPVRALQAAPGGVSQQPTMQIGGGNTGGRTYTPNYFAQQGPQAQPPGGGPSTPPPKAGAGGGPKAAQGMAGKMQPPGNYTPPVNPMRQGGGAMPNSQLLPQMAQAAALRGAGPGGMAMGNATR